MLRVAEGKGLAARRRPRRSPARPRRVSRCFLRQHARLSCFTLQHGRSTEGGLAEGARRVRGFSVANVSEPGVDEMLASSEIK